MSRCALPELVAGGLPPAVLDLLPRWWVPAVHAGSWPCFPWRLGGGGRGSAGLAGDVCYGAAAGCRVFDVLASVSRDCLFDVLSRRPAFRAPVVLSSIVGAAGRLGPGVSAGPNGFWMPAWSPAPWWRLWGLRVWRLGGHRSVVEVMGPVRVRGMRSKRQCFRDCFRVAVGV